MPNADALLFNISSFIAGLFLLQYGAEKFMDHTTVVARRLNVSETLIGLLTCGAEWEGLVVIAVALSQKNPDLALGSVFGASIANILSSFSLGLLVMNRVEYDRSCKVYSAVLLAVTTLFLVLLATLKSGPKWLAGALLLGAFVLYVVSIAFFVCRGTLEPPECRLDTENHHYDPLGHTDADTGDKDDPYESSSESSSHLEHGHPLSILPNSKSESIPNSTTRRLSTTPALVPQKPTTIPHHLIHLTLGLAALLISSYIVAHSAATIGRALGLSGTAVGTTILSLATTLPDKFVAVLGGVRQQPGILVANTVGSNIFLATLCGGVLFACGGQMVRGMDIGRVGFEMAVMWLSSASVLAIVVMGGWVG